MKILKLVLIAILTVSIYSFTFIKNNDEISKNVNVENYDGCLTIIFAEGTNTYQRSQARIWINWYYNVQLVNLKEQTSNSGSIQENWDYIINVSGGGRTMGNHKNDDDDKEDDWKNANQYLIYHALGCGTTFIHGF